MIGWLHRAADALRRRTYSGDHGRMGEDFAHRYLRKHGCTVVARNYSPRSGPGEVDLVVWHGATLVFVEVKTRATSDYGAPASAVDTGKRDRIRRGARDYVRRAGIPWERTRFDLVNIVLGKPVQVEWTRGAFGNV